MLWLGKMVLILESLSPSVPTILNTPLHVRYYSLRFFRVFDLILPLFNYSVVFNTFFRWRIFNLLHLNMRSSCFAIQWHWLVIHSPKHACYRTFYTLRFKFFFLSNFFDSPKFFSLFYDFWLVVVKWSFDPDKESRCLNFSWEMEKNAALCTLLWILFRC